MIELLKYLLLGIVQGIAEILPISSSGHLALLQQLLNVNAANEAVFAIFLHFASLMALVIFFYKTIWQIIKGFFIFIFKRDQKYKGDFMMALYIVGASIPAAVVGFLLEDAIGSIFGSLLYVGIGFLITAAILFAWPFIGRAKDEQVGWKHVLWAGLFQAFGVLPGVSRSGVTITGAKLGGLQETEAKKFAFLLFIPIALGSFVLSLTDVAQIVNADRSALINYGAAMIAAFIFTYAALALIFRQFRYAHAKYYAIYLTLIGIFAIVMNFVI